MFSKIQWRITVISIGFIILGMFLLNLYLSRTTCTASPTCVRQTIGAATIILLLGAVVVGYVVAERTAKPIRNLTLIAERIANGDIQARLLPQTWDEVGKFNQAFNRMIEKLEQRLTLLEEEQSQLATAVALMADGVIITDERGYVHLINPAAATMLNTDEQNGKGRSFAEVVRHHELIDLRQRCQRENKEQTAAIEVGRELFLQVIMTPIQEDDAQGYLVILQNLTPIRRLETIRRDFISNISHELRTPLASLRAVVETLQDHAIEEKEVAQRFLGRAESEIDVMTQMVEELLELSKIESGQVPLKLAPTAVSQLILNPIERVQEQANRQNIQLKVKIPDDMPDVLADSGRIHQVMSNLLHNALKFTDQGGTIEIAAAAKSKQYPNMVVISIKDTGVGIPADDIPRIFERFYKSDRARTRQHGGTGLGLAISRHIVNAHNGRIWVTSRENQGSTFSFTLPQAGY